jgi:hypothetical protein
MRRWKIPADADFQLGDAAIAGRLRLPCLAEAMRGGKQAGDWLWTEYSGRSHLVADFL